MKNSNMSNIKAAASDSIGVATSTFALALTLTAGAIKLAGGIVKAAPEVAQATAELPFSASQGYIAEDEGIEMAEARGRAFKYVDQDLATTIADAGKGSGKLIAQLFADMDTDANDADKVTA